MFHPRSWITRPLARTKPYCHPARLRVEEMESRVTPTTYYVTPPPGAPLTDASALRSAVNGATDGDTIALEGGLYTLTANQLNITHNLTFIRDTVMNPNSTLIEIEDDSSGSPGILTISSGKILTATDTLNMQFNGAVHGSGELTKDGSGTLTLTTASDYSGSTYVAGGLLAVDDDSDLGASGTSVQLTSASATVKYLNTTTTARGFGLGSLGTLAAPSGVTVTMVGDSATNGYLDGGGTFATSSSSAVTFNNVSIKSGTTVNSNNAGDRFQTFGVNGTLNVASGLNTSGSGTVHNFDSFYIYGGGSVTIGAASRFNALNFTSFGNLTLDPATIGSGNYTLLRNLGTSDMTFDDGSVTNIGTAATATTGSPPTPSFVAGFDLHGYNADVSGSVSSPSDHVGALFINNGFVSDSTASSTSAVTVDGNKVVDGGITYYGGLVKGAGYWQRSVITYNDGHFQAGNSPGVDYFSAFTFGPGGVGNYNFVISNATGTAGPTPDSEGHVDGWSLIRAEDFTWTADADHKLSVSLQTLVNPTTVGNDVPGTMDNFDPTQSYRWAAVQWTGTYSGPTDVAALNSSTTFDTSAFQNSFNGTFAWDLDTSAGTLYLTYTPA